MRDSTKALSGTTAAFFGLHLSMTALRACLAVVILNSTALAGSQSVESTPGNAELLNLIEEESKANTNSVKDEFETTAHYQQRIRTNVGREFEIYVNAMSDAPWSGVKPKALAYDADTQTLRVTLTGHSDIKASQVFELTSPDGKPPALALSDGRYTKFTLSKEVGPSRKYVAQNAMGAKIEVNAIDYSFAAVAFLNLPEKRDVPLPTIELKMLPEVARVIEKRAQWRIFIKTDMAPGQKSLVLSDFVSYKATITDPTELTLAGKTITASMMRADLVDPETNLVITSFGPKPSTTSQPLGTQDAHQSTATLPPSCPSRQSDAKTPPPPKIGGILISVNQKMADQMHLPDATGVFVFAVLIGSVAEAAGIRRGDVILRIGQKAIASFCDVPDSLVGTEKGSKIPITIRRDGVESVVQAQF